ncbi:hypothetical protein [Flexilinea flocculi]|uniref:Uncharacterized protein n=1 Tax=Flexilinea flocculi TaxID=1678840 RepID=A0A0S7BK12_9CHLR|nr:hypothetical protein [Flexilinea flocculi]GAP40685.1 hypothetical protein ATC1_13664 [Flexilinea flocculi]
MNKGIGFSRTITLDWLDVTASLCVQNTEPLTIRQRLAETISGTVIGIEAERKTIDVLSAIWVKSEKTAPQIRKEALSLFSASSTSGERFWLHYGMTLVCYPIFRKVTAAIGQISRTEEIITRKMIKDRISGEYGHLGGLDRSVERIIASLTNWGAIMVSGEKQNYQILLRHFSSRENLQLWLLGSALYAHPADGLPFDDLIHLPELYPFQLTVGVDNLRKDKRFEVQRQGGGLEMVRII